MGLWSTQISDNNGNFAQPIVLTLTSVGQYSSQGLTLVFDTYNNIFPKDINIKWYRDEQLISQANFKPDNAKYFCYNKVDNYNGLVITFYNLNMPQNRLKVWAIDYGYGTFFYGDVLRNAKQIQEIDPISSQIAINTLDFVLDIKTNIEYSFQRKQPLTTYFNGKLISTNFVKSSKRQGKKIWQIQSEDYIGLMDGVDFEGGIYSGKDAYDLLVEIFTVAKVPYVINGNLKGVLLYGYIPFTNCRDALMQVAFAVQNVVDTSNSAEVKVFELEDDIKQTIPLGRIMQGQNFMDEETVTAVELIAHTYTKVSDTMQVYKAEENGTGKNIFVKFTQPLHSLTITNGTIVLGKTNYAIINAQEGCVLSGKKYEHTKIRKRKDNPIVLASDIEKVIAIENATLISSHNVDKVLEKCYNWLIRTQTTNLKIVEGKHIIYGEPNTVIYDKTVNVGDNINTETEYLGVVNGRLIKQSFGLNGNIIIKEAVLK
jgi:hypothetical protein